MLPRAHPPPIAHRTQMTLYVPGPVLREGRNEVVLLEVERAAREEAGVGGGCGGGGTCEGGAPRVVMG